MNVIVTGEIQKGKSTAVRRALERLKRPDCGFLTRFDRDRRELDRRLLLLTPQGGELGTLVSFEGGRPRVHLETFETLGVDCLSGGAFAVMDELGKFERDTVLFRQAVEDVFSSHCDVLAVVRYRAEGWVERLKSRPDVTLITLTEENRDSVPEEIVRLFTERN